jgi:hypothetical protein
MTGRFFASTTGPNKSYIGTLWNARHELSDSEKRGFAQFFYLTISGHIESFLSKVISARLDSILRLPLESLPPREGSICGEQVSCSVEPICDSLVSIISVYKSKVGSASLGKLLGFYQNTFQKNLLDVIGQDLYQDIHALSALRNILAHGRDLYLEFDTYVDDSEFTQVVTLDNNPLQKPISRLRTEGIVNIRPSDIDGMNWVDFLAALYCDEALLYFYDAVKEIESKLRQSVDYSFESSSLYIVPLPDLGDSDGNSQS